MKKASPHSKENKELAGALIQAHRDVDPIEPWWSEEDDMYLFEHKAYPSVTYADENKEACAAGYVRALEEFVTARLKEQIPEFVERITSGRGGIRPRSGRPKNPIKTVNIRIPEDVAQWLKNCPEHIDQVRKLMKR